MIALKASKIAEIVGGALDGADVEVTAPAVINSGLATAGSLFCAYIGEATDGHQFVEDAFNRGSVLALVSKPVAEPHILVSDVTQALGKLAHYVRTQLSSLQVVGITGSQGKTTTKELVTALLAPHRKTIAPSGNYNNEIGVPLTLLQCTEETEVCIVEMGARHAGDIAHLVEIAQPNIGVVLRVAAAHIGEFGSIEKIAETKAEMFTHLNSNATAIAGLYDSYTEKMQKLHSGRTLTFGEKQGADIRGTEVELREGRAHFDLVTPDGRSTVALRVVGAHQVSNALAAAAIAHELGLTNDQIAAGLSMAESHAKWRMEIHELSDLLLINDAYNASPDSMEQALKTLTYFAQERGGESWAFLGTMRELGESADVEHRKVALCAADLGVDHLVAVNTPSYQVDSETMTIHHCLTHEQALELVQYINPGDVVLCKASRSEKFELIAEKIEEMWSGKVVE